MVVALLAGVGVWFFAIRDTKQTTGQGSPQDAVTALFASLGNSDPIGLADQLDPTEASLFTDLNADMISELKRLDVLGSAASADSMTGTKISVSGVTFDGADETINENLRIVKLSGGTVTVASNPDQIPLGDKIKKALAKEIDQAQPKTQTINIADAVADNGGPIRVATVKRGDQWYVSLFYTVADNATHQAGLPNPTDADRIPAAGSASPEAAARSLIDKASTGDLTGLIALTPPDEMGALHDYGKLLVKEAGGTLSSDIGKAGFKIGDPTFSVTDVTGGKKVSLQSLTITTDGQTATITRDPAAGSLTVQAPGQATVTLDESSIDTYIAQAAGSQDLDPALVEIIKREFKQIIGLGIVTVQVDGQWYVSPVRSFSDVFVSLLKGLEPSDIDYFISLAGN